MKRSTVFLSAFLLTLLLSACSTSAGSGGVSRMIDEVNAGNYIDAAEIYSDSIYGNTEKEYQAKQALEAQLDQALDDYNTGEKSYDEASNTITTVDRVNVLSIERVDRASTTLSALQSSKAAFESAEALFASGLYADALDNYLSVIEADSNYSAAQQKAAESKTSFLAELNAELEGYLAADEYNAALERLDDALRMLPGETALTARQTEVEAKLLNHALEQAEETFSAGNDYEAAIRIITAAQNKLGENDQLTAALEKYQGYIPVYLNELEYIDKEGELFLEASPRDNYGNEYTYGLFVSNWGDNYVTYYLNGNYSSLTGTCAVSDERKNYDGQMYFEIFGDGVLLYRSNTMAKGSAPYDFSVDVTGVAKLTIDYPYEDDIGACSQAVLCDAILQK